MNKKFLVGLLIYTTPCFANVDDTCNSRSYKSYAQIKTDRENNTAILNSEKFGTIHFSNCKQYDRYGDGVYDCGLEKFGEFTFSIIVEDIVEMTLTRSAILRVSDRNNRILEVVNMECQYPVYPRS